MPLDFPSSPSNGQVYDQWQWDGSKWVAIVGALPAGPAGPTGPQGAGVAAGGTTGQALTKINATDFNTQWTGPYLTGNQSITLSGDISGSGTTAITTTLATVPVAKGGTGSTTAPNALTALGAVAKAGDTMTGDLTLSENKPAGSALITVSNVGNVSNTFSALHLATGPSNSTVALGVNHNLEGFLSLGSDLTGGMVWYINSGSPTARLDASGNLTTIGDFTINENKPAGQAHIYVNNVGTASNTFSILRLTTGGAGTSSAEFGLSHNSEAYIGLGSAVANGFAWYMSSGSARIDNGGNITISGGIATKAGGGPWVAPSDRSLKSTIAPWPTGLAAVLALRPVSYRYSNDDWNIEQNYIGLDAEDAAAVIPEMGRTITLPPSSQVGKAQPDVAALDSGPLLYALVTAVKELSAEIDAIKAALPGVTPLPSAGG